jgi:hypothetical protein
MNKKRFGPAEEKLIWASTRSVLELDDIKYKKNGKRSQSHWTTFERILRFLTFFLRVFGFLKKGEKNALDIKKNEQIFYFEKLPKEFDGFKILHLSDLHLDSLGGITEKIASLVADETFDICVMTGDYRFHTQGSYKQVIEPLKKITSQIKSRHGILAVLGNHDTCKIVNYEDELQVKFLINESFEILKNNQKLIFSGTDDPFKYFTQSAVDALTERRDGFKVALVHTSELSDSASQNGYSLYLCGHTHAGQICLPGGIPLITHQYEGRKFYKGVWHLNGMTGFTSPGCGVSGIPIRFYTRGEVTRIILKSK